MSRKSAFITGLALIAAVLTVVGLYLCRTRPPAEVKQVDLENREGLLYVHNFKEPYTGALVETFPNGKPKLRIDIRRGKVDGLSRGWYENGQLEVQETFVAGTSHGPRTRWFANGQERSEEKIEHGVVTGPYVAWHESGQKAVEMTLRNGQPDGLALAWFPNGALKSETRFVDGKMQDRKFLPASPATATDAKLLLEATR